MIDDYLYLIDQMYLKESNESNQIDDLVMYKTKDCYSFKNKKGVIVSKLNYYDYKIENFDWILLANIETKPAYRGKGLATKLIDEICTDINKKYKNKGVYLFVRDNNDTAIRLYTKLKFKRVKNYKLEDGNYIIMAKGPADINQLHTMNFS